MNIEWAPRMRVSARGTGHVQSGYSRRKSDTHTVSVTYQAGIQLRLQNQCESTYAPRRAHLRSRRGGLNLLSTRSSGTVHLVVGPAAFTWAVLVGTLEYIVPGYRTESLSTQDGSCRLDNKILGYTSAFRILVHGSTCTDW